MFILHKMKNMISYFRL